MVLYVAWHFVIKSKALLDYFVLLKFISNNYPRMTFKSYFFLCKLVKHQVKASLYNLLRFHTFLSSKTVVPQLQCWLFAFYVYHPALKLGLTNQKQRWHVTKHYITDCNAYQNSEPTRDYTIKCTEHRVPL